MCALYATLEIACVHLQSWLCCPAFHSTSGVWFCYAGSKAQLAHLTLVEDIVVVIAMSVLKLLVVCVYVLTDVLGVRKSNGVPSTFSISPVGMLVSSIGR